MEKDEEGNDSDDDTDDDNDDFNEDDSVKDNDYQPDEDDSIELDFKRISFSHRYCFVCKVEFNKDNSCSVISIIGIVNILSRKK